MKSVIALLSIFFLTELANAQDTLIVCNNYKFKMGVKSIFEQSISLGRANSESHAANGGGIQVINKLGKSKSSIETGIYYTTKVDESDYYISTGIESADKYTFTIPYHYLTVPISYRFDTKVFYFTGGFFVDYLISKNVEGKYLDYYLNHERKLNFGSILTLGLEKAVSKNLSVFVEGRYSITWSSSKTNISTSGYSNYGIAVGINYKVLRKN